LSHDRGCPCGREPYEYEDCRMQECPKAGYLGLRREEVGSPTREAAQRDEACANDRQVGGSHYRKGELQHWDVVDKFGVPYLEGVGSKYPLRWREKGGVEDLEKTLHYIDKILESPEDHPRWRRSRQLTANLLRASNDLCDAHSVGSVERRVVLSLLQGVSCDRLQNVRGELADYIAKVKCNSPGSPEDGGHHARQAEDGEGAPVDLTVTERHLHLHLPDGCGGALALTGDQVHLTWGRP
jgi:hypothetical protein